MRFGLIVVLLAVAIGCDDSVSVPKAQRRGRQPSPDASAQDAAPEPASGSQDDDAGIAGEPVDAALSDASITAKIALDSARSVSVLVPANGGSVSATGADGTRYELTLPADALLEPTTITLTPVTELTELPIETQAPTRLGVQFGPDGLFLYKVATLRITPAESSNIPLERQLFVQWQREGENIALAAPVPTSRELQISVSHFSGFGVVYTKGFDAALTVVGLQVGGDAERRLTNALAQRAMFERLRQLRGQGSDDSTLLQQIDDYGDAFEILVLKPRLAAAGTSCAAGRLAQETALNMKRQYEVAGLRDRWSQYAVEIAPTVTLNCMREEYELCREQHVLTRLLRIRLGLARQLEILGMPADAADPTYDGFVTACYKFELDIDSTATETLDSPPATITQSVEARQIALQLHGSIADWRVGASGILLATAPVASTHYTVKGGDKCNDPVNVTPTNSTVFVMNLTLDSGNPPTDVLKDFRLVYAPGPNMSAFSWLDHCADPPQTSPPIYINWAYVEYAVLGASNALSSKDNGFVVTHWNVKRDTEIGKKYVDLRVDMAGIPMRITDEFTLRHVPSPN